MSTETSCHFGHLLQVLKKISLESDFIHFFFMLLYMYIDPGQGLTTPWGRNVDVNRNILSLRTFGFEDRMWDQFLIIAYLFTLLHV